MDTEDSSVAFVVLVGRPKLAIETIKDFLRLSEFARTSSIYAFYFPGALSERAITDIDGLADNISVVPTSIVFPRFERPEMFYSRKNEYAKRFGRGRIGYLDMCYWTTNFFSEPELAAFDFILRFDDDSWLKKSPDARLADALKKNDWVVASAGSNSALSQNSWDTRENFYWFTKDFLHRHHIDARDSTMKFLLQNNDEVGFHSLPRSLGNFNLYRASAFRSDTWFRWVYAVNLFGGHHRFRWSDIIVTGTFGRIFREDSFLDLGLVRDQMYWKRKPGTMPLRRGISQLVTMARSIWHRFSLRL